MHSSAEEDGGALVAIRSALLLNLSGNATLGQAAAKGAGGAVFVRQHPGPVELNLQDNASIVSCTAGAEGGVLSTSQALSSSGGSAVSNILSGGSQNNNGTRNATLSVLEETVGRGVAVSLKGSSKIKDCHAGERGGVVSLAMAPLKLTLSDAGELVEASPTLPAQVMHS